MTLTVVKCNCLSCKINRIKDMASSANSLWSKEYWTKVFYLLQYLHSKNNKFMLDKNRFDYLFVQRMYYEDLKKFGYLNANE